MNRIHIIGGKNHGKTTLIVELVTALTRQGLRVGTIKHTHHQHELDTPGKDSHRHREAGADVVGIVTPSANCVFWNPEIDQEEKNATSKDERKYARFASMFESCDLVIVEGDSQTQATKIEVWRSAVGTPPLAAADHSIHAIVTDDRPNEALSIPLWPRSDVEAIAQTLANL